MIGLILYINESTGALHLVMSNVRTVAYYERLGSRLGYQLLLGGHRHFGWYKQTRYLNATRAAEAMIDHLAEFAEIKKGSRVLDAGCGQGRASLRLAKNYGARVSGVDLVPRSIGIAQDLAGGNDLLDFQVADYNKLPFQDGTFDVVFTLETFTHSSDPEATLKEFLRVLKPGGRIVLFDYSIAPLASMPTKTARAIKVIADKTDCPGFASITHDYYDKLLPKLGVSKFVVINETEAIMPVIRFFYHLSWAPYHLLKLLRKQYDHPNVLIGHIARDALRKDYIRYITVKIVK